MPIIVMRMLEVVCHQLPRIADSLERIANAIENKEEKKEVENV